MSAIDCLQTLLGDLANVLAIDADRALGHVVHAHQQAHQRGLAGAARPDQSDALSCGNGQLEVLDHVAQAALLVRTGQLVREGNAIEVNAALGHRQRAAHRACP